MSHATVADPLLQIGTSNGTSLNIDMDDIWLATLQPDRSGHMSPTLCASMSPASDSTRSTSFFDEATFFDDFVDTFTSCASPLHQYGHSNSPYTVQYNQGQQTQLFQQRNHSYSDSNLIPVMIDQDASRNMNEGYNNGNTIIDNRSPYNFANDNSGYGCVRGGIAMPQSWTEQTNTANSYSFIPSYSPNIGNHGINMTSRNTPPAGISRSQSMYTPSNTGNRSGRSSPGIVMTGAIAPHTSPVLPAKITPNMNARNTSMDLLSLSSVSSDYFDTQTYYPSPSGNRSSGIAAAGILPRINSNSGTARPFVAPPSPKSTISAYSAGQSSPAGYSSSSSSPRKRKLKGSTVPTNTPQISAFGSKEAIAAYGGSSSSRKSKKIHSMLEDLVTILRTMKRHDVRLKDLAASATPAALATTPMNSDPFASPINQGYVARDCPTPNLDKLSLNTPNGPAPPQFLFGMATRLEKDALSSQKNSIINMNQRKTIGLTIVRAMLGISGESLSDICTTEAKFSYPQSFFPTLRQLSSSSMSPMPLFPDQTSRSPKLKSGKDMSNRISPRSSPRNNARQSKDYKPFNDSLPSSHVVSGQSTWLVGNTISNMIAKLLTTATIRGPVISEVYEDEANDSHSFFCDRMWIHNAIRCKILFER